MLGLVPARAGSKGVPGKNTRPLGGRPLLAWTIEAALGARSLARTVVSTDDEGIAALARDLGAEVPFLRPRDLATDEAPMLPVVEHALESIDEPFDAVCLLQPTTPFRTVADIDDAVALLDATGADSVVSFVAVGDGHPARMRRVGTDQRVEPGPVPEPAEGTRRQDLEPLYLRAGSIYLARVETIRAGSLIGDDCRALVIPRERAVNIDDELDLAVAEALASR